MHTICTHSHACVSTVEHAHQEDKAKPKPWVHTELAPNPGSVTRSYMSFLFSGLLNIIMPAVVPMPWCLSCSWNREGHSFGDQGHSPLHPQLCRYLSDLFWGPMFAEQPIQRADLEIRAGSPSCSFFLLPGGEKEKDKPISIFMTCAVSSPLIESHKRTLERHSQPRAGYWLSNSQNSLNVFELFKCVHM